jgi:hypothetical protein
MVALHLFKTSGNLIPVLIIHCHLFSLCWFLVIKPQPHLYWRLLLKQITHAHRETTFVRTVHFRFVVINKIDKWECLKRPNCPWSSDLWSLHSWTNIQWDMEVYHTIELLENDLSLTWTYFQILRVWIKRRGISSLGWRWWTW